jgi:hypothetical protein
MPGGQVVALADGSTRRSRTQQSDSGHMVVLEPMPETEPRIPKPPEAGGDRAGRTSPTAGSLVRSEPAGSTNPASLRHPFTTRDVHALWPTQLHPKLQAEGPLARHHRRDPSNPRTGDAGLLRMERAEAAV